MHAIDTAGRAVLFAGVTVMISLLGMFLIGVSVHARARGRHSLAVLLVMVASVTLLPAVLGFVGPHDRPVRRARSPARRTRTARATLVPVDPGGAAPAVAAALAASRCSWCSRPCSHAPRLHRRRQRPDKSTTRAAYDLLADGFGPGFNGPLVLAADAPPRDVAAVEARHRDREGRPASRSEPGRRQPDGARRACIQVVPDGLAAGPGDDAADPPPARRRDPRRHGGTDAEVYVGGPRLRRRRHRRLSARLRACSSRGDLLLSFLLLMLGVPIAARAAQGRGHEPAVDRRRVRRDRRGVPVGLARRASSASARTGRSRRGSR